MKCKKCGAEYSEGDVFCGNCGEKIIIEAESEGNSINDQGNTLLSDKTEDNTNVHDNKSSGKKVDTEKKKPWTKIAICAVLAIAVIAVGLFILSRPKDVEFEANELGKILYTDDIEQYYGDTLHVHGFLYRDVTSDDLCVLYTDENDENMVTFVYEAGLDEELGNGSEIVVTGTIGYKKSDPSTDLLLAKTIEVVNRVEPVYEFATVALLLNAADDCIDKEISITGLVDRASWDVVYLSDFGDTRDGYVLLKNIDANYLLSMTAGTYSVKGTFYSDKGNPAIDVKEIELIEESMSTDFDSPNELLDAADWCDGQVISVVGWIDAYDTTAYIADGYAPIELRDLTEQEIMALYGGYSKITGVFHSTEYGYAIDVTYVGE